MRGPCCHTVLGQPLSGETPVVKMTLTSLFSLVSAAAWPFYFTSFDPLTAGTTPWWRPPAPLCPGSSRCLTAS